MPNELEIRQTTGFDPPTEDPEIAPDQHHLKASTLNPEHSMRFVTVMWVDRDTDLQGAAQDESTNITKAWVYGQLKTVAYRIRRF